MTKRVDLDNILPDEVFCYECGERIDSNTLSAWTLNIPLCKTCWLIRRTEEE